MGWCGTRSEKTDSAQEERHCAQDNSSNGGVHKFTEIRQLEFERYSIWRLTLLERKIEGPAAKKRLIVMQKLCLNPGGRSIFGMLVAIGLAVVVPSLHAQQNQAGSDSPQAAWSSIQQLVKDMETTVQSKNLHGIHDPTMKIRAPIKTLKQHSSMLSGVKGQKLTAALKQLDSSITDLHSASDEGNQEEAQKALKEVETALDQLKTEDPDAAFKNMH